MAVPILAFLATMGARYGASKAITMAIKKFGKKALQKATNKMIYVGKNVAKKTVKKKPKVFDLKTNKPSNRYLPTKSSKWHWNGERGVAKALRPKVKPKGINPYTLADWKQGIKYPAKVFAKGKKPTKKKP